jgi:hypothetical protein
MSSRIGVALLFSVVMAINGVAAASAQPATGQPVTGVVVDQSGAVLQSAQVELRTAAGAVVGSTQTDAAGTFRFEHVAPGRFEVLVTFEGFRPSTARITVGTRAPAPAHVMMPLAGITQEVTVGNAPAEVKANAASNLDAASIDSASIENLPVFDQDVLATVSRFLDATAVGNNGATLVVNGMEMNSLNVSASAIQQIKINQDPYSAEYSRPGRGRIEVVLKPGSQEYHGTGNFFFRDSSVDSRNAFAASRPPEQRRIFEGFLSGPAGHSDKTSFTISLKNSAEDTESIVFAQTLDGTVQQNVASPYRNVLAAGTINHQHGEKTTMSLTASYEDETRHTQGVGGVTLPSAASNWNSIEQAATYTQQTIVTPTLLNQFRLFVGQEFETTTSVNQGARLVVLDAFTSGGAQADQLRTEHHFTLTDTLTWSPGRHTVKGGLNIPDWSRRRNDDNSNSTGTFYFSSLADYAASRPYSFVQQIGNGHVAFLEKVVGLFVQDEIRLSPRLSTTIGMRYDWQNYVRDHNNFAPRASIAFAPAADGKTVIRSGVGVFYDRTGPRPIQDVLRYDGVRQLRFVITDPGYPNPLGAGQNLAAQPPSVVQFAPDLVIPALLQFSASLERQLAKGTSASVTYTGSRGYNQFLSRDLNAPPPPLFAARVDPTRGVVREIESAGRMRGDSLQFTLRGKLTDLVKASVQYTLSETKNNTSGTNWMPPDAYDLSLEYARADFDQRHRFDMFATVNPGAWFNVGVAVALYSGRPYSLTTGHDDFNTGSANARPVGVPRNSLEGPGYADVDLRWSHDVFFNRIKKGDGPTFTLGVDAFNVLNRVNVSGFVGTLTSPFFGQAIAAQAPRRFQFSARTRF